MGKPKNGRQRCGNPSSIQLGEGTALCMDPMPYGDVGGWICDEDRGKGTETYQYSMELISSLVKKKLDSIGRRIPGISSNCRRLDDLMDEYASSGVPQYAVEKYSVWVCKEKERIRAVVRTINDLMVQCYMLNDVGPIVEIIDSNKELDDG